MYRYFLIVLVVFFRASLAFAVLQDIDKLFAIVEDGSGKYIVECKNNGFDEFLFIGKDNMRSATVVFTTENSLAPSKDAIYGLENDSPFIIKDKGSEKYNLKIVKGGFPLVYDFGEGIYECEMYYMLYISNDYNYSKDEYSVYAYFNKKELVERRLFLIGTLQKHAFNIEDGSLELTNRGTNDFYGEFPVDKTSYQYPMFRFYTALGDWNNNSVGCGLRDETVDIAALPYTGPVVPDGKSVWALTGWDQDLLCIHLNLHERTIEISGKMYEANTDIVNEDDIKLIGDCVILARKGRIEIYNLAGNCVMEAYESTLDLSPLTSGVYVVKAGGEVMLVKK